MPCWKHSKAAACHSMQHRKIMTCRPWALGRQAASHTQNVQSTTNVTITEERVQAEDRQFLFSIRGLWLKLYEALLQYHCLVTSLQVVLTSPTDSVCHPPSRPRKESRGVMVWSSGLARHQADVRRQVASRPSHIPRIRRCKSLDCGEPKVGVDSAGIRPLCQCMATRPAGGVPLPSRSCAGSPTSVAKWGLSGSAAQAWPRYGSPVLIALCTIASAEPGQTPAEDAPSPASRRGMTLDTS